MTFQMHSRSLAFFVAALFLFMFWSGVVTYEPGRSAAPAAAAEAGMQSKTERAQHPPSVSAEHYHPDEPSTQAQAEGSMDLPDLVQHLGDARVPALGTVRPSPHQLAIWHAPILDGLRRPPREILATA